MTKNTHPEPQNDKVRRYVWAAVIIASAFVLSIRLTSGSAIAAAKSGNCCGGGGAPIAGSATVQDGVQRITVDASSGFNPNAIKLKAGVPAEITFENGGGCTAQVVSDDLKFSEDLSQGPKTVKLPALEAGTYKFSCGMQMQFGTIEVS